MLAKMSSRGGFDAQTAEELQKNGTLKSRGPEAVEISSFSRGMKSKNIGTP